MLGGDSEYFLKARSNSMPRNTLERIFQNVHLCDNEQLGK